MIYISTTWTWQRMLPFNGASAPSATLATSLFHLSSHIRPASSRLKLWPSNSDCFWPSTCAAHADLPLLSGHSLRIGGCTELLLRGVPIDTVRIVGRCTSEAWKRYIRRHIEILVPNLAYTRPQTAAEVAAHGIPSANNQAAAAAT
ncbi:hypothetical protein A4X03_0g8100 [Tilletia caries]|uniref:Uncharacterized protein n=1 Tax=Tilletia caries TaxID=13290 RepID=A0A8T8SJQ5_9BASI|nr:hypothetical protein A4X03_0g8100 [Tilletia caries]